MHPQSRPGLLRELIARLPQYPPAAVVAFGLNALLGPVLSAKNLPGARGKVIRVAVRDLGLDLAFTLDEAGVVALGGDVSPDVTIRADLRDFVALARRAEDPDTLFFSRRLIMEGDTELGLLVKNTLDAVDWRALGPPPPGRVLAALKLQARSMVERLVPR
jgi:predicted lipid carrier protein YhbT